MANAEINVIGNYTHSLGVIEEIANYQQDIFKRTIFVSGYKKIQLWNI